MSIDFQTIGAYPSGLVGRIAGLFMNCIHSHQYKKIAKHILDGIDTAKALRILDVGCGGGKAIRLFRALAADADVHGVDISPDMVALAGRVNKEGVRNGRVASFRRTWPLYPIRIIRSTSSRHLTP